MSKSGASFMRLNLLCTAKFKSLRWVFRSRLIAVTQTLHLQRPEWDNFMLQQASAVGHAIIKPHRALGI